MTGLPDFKQKNSGHIINLGSVAGREPYAGGSIYTATKHAVHAFTVGSDACIWGPFQHLTCLVLGFYDEGTSQHSDPYDRNSAW